MNLDVLCAECGTLKWRGKLEDLECLDDTLLIRANNCPLCLGAALAQQRDEIYEQARQEILEGLESKE